MELHRPFAIGDTNVYYCRADLCRFRSTPARYDRRGGGGGRVGGSAVRVAAVSSAVTGAPDAQLVAPTYDRRIRAAASVNAAFVFIATFLLLCVIGVWICDQSDGSIVWNYICIYC